jgi:hypothetical protein
LTDDDVKQAFEDFQNRVGLIGLIDHHGRAGNGFVLSIFDQHPEVLTCPWVHYDYTYVMEFLGMSNSYPSSLVKSIWPRKAYYRYLYNELTPEMAAAIVKPGGDPSAPVNREKVRRVFDLIVEQEDVITRKQLILASYFSYAMGVGRNLQKIKYIMTSSAVSLRTETPLDGFQGQMIDFMAEDFKDFKLVCLVRDPRAQFASTYHQFINTRGNTYGIFPGNYFCELIRACGLDLHMESGCIFMHFLSYMASASRTIYRKLVQYADQAYIIRNEDLNLNFVPTMVKICQWFDIHFLDSWKSKAYEPTMVGRPWRGTGAYNSRYQTVTNGPLENDSDNVAKRVTGPNEYVTRRWRSRLKRNEIELMDYLFYDELCYHGYDFYLPSKKRRSTYTLLTRLLKPFSGEWPTWKWILKGKKIGVGALAERLWYALFFFPFYVLSRFRFLTIVLKYKLFKLDFIDQVKVPRT